MNFFILYFVKKILSIRRTRWLEISTMKYLRRIRNAGLQLLIVVIEKTLMLINLMFTVVMSSSSCGRYSIDWCVPATSAPVEHLLLVLQWGRKAVRSTAKNTRVSKMPLMRWLTSLSFKLLYFCILPCMSHFVFHTNGCLSAVCDKFIVILLNSLFIHNTHGT